MAQKTENEETEFKAVPEALTLCVNNCGVTGNPSTNNMCQKCFTSSTATSSSSSSILKFSSSARSAPTSSKRSADLTCGEVKSPDPTANTEDKPPKPTTPLLNLSKKREVNRCSGCKRKVGLTGFRCRCGELFCSEHRYTDRHDCNYDYKAAGREAIARDNPVVKAAKIIKV